MQRDPQAKGVPGPPPTQFPLAHIHPHGIGRKEFADFPRHNKVLLRDRNKAFIIDRNALVEVHWKKQDS